MIVHINNYLLKQFLQQEPDLNKYSDDASHKYNM